MSSQKTVLILQGGGALGAYQAGVYERLHQSGLSRNPVSWLIGTSIGATNAAIIAGNPPEKRVTQLKAFWESLAPENLPTTGLDPWAVWQKMLAPYTNMMTGGGDPHTQNTLKQGVHGFFKPRTSSSLGYVDIQAPRPILECSFYDTSAFKATLERFVDFELLNQCDVRISVTAVDIETGQQRVFDSNTETIRPEHIMASGALPPGFPAIQIDGRLYWDGGVYSNTPLEILLADPSYKDVLCFMVDLWDPHESVPRNIYDVMSHWKTIQYASRLRERVQYSKQVHNIRAAINEVASLLSPEQKKDKRFKSLLDYGSERSINVIHLVLRAAYNDDYFKDIDFRAETVANRWKSGMDDASYALRQADWFAPLPTGSGLVIHELNEA